MINMDKILARVPKQVIDTINTLAKENDRTQLEKWLKECKQEIEFRHEQNLDMNWVYYEMYYLETILN